MQMTIYKDNSLGYRTNLAARLFVRELSRRLETIGLSIGHMPVFVALGAGEAMTQRDLAREALVEQSTMAATLSRMERDGLIERKPDPSDGRSALVSLTAGATAKLPQLAEAVADVNATAAAVLDAEEERPFMTTLDKIIAALSEADRAAQGPER
jgi:DNA-binding MarR family transcriptional regulator